MRAHFFLAGSLLPLLMLSCTQAKKPDCDQIKSGTLRYYSKETNVTFDIKRKGSVQIEQERVSKKKSTWRITWVDDCTYNLLLLDADDYDMSQQKLRPSLNFQVVKTTKDYYLFRPESEFLDAAADTIWKVQ